MKSSRTFCLPVISFQDSANGTKSLQLINCSFLAEYYYPSAIIARRQNTRNQQKATFCFFSKTLFTHRPTMSIVSLFLGLICGLLLMFCSHCPGAGKCQLIWGTDEQLSKAILEMLHINKLSIPLRTKPHHYMKLVYHLRNPPALNSEGTLVQSFRSIQAILNETTSDVIGFQLRFTDDSGSLVLHEALTKSLYCLNRCTRSEPLLVAYRFLVTELYGGSKQQVTRECQHCATERRRNLPEDSRLQQCSLHQHYVNFQTMQLSHWILEPPGFFTSFCKGECSDEESGELSEAQRGVINKTENRMSSRCVPQKRSSINVMYLSHSEDLVIERLKDLRVESCACNQLF
ncbi:protein dbl-1-like isoform X2 [Chrysemys picta bellii]|uniref:protein dbl-1-like isoform X2 n=1 Tax=Chrysemys picta bellii TaxID=8478 RepID=UPI0032B2C172